MKLLTLTPRQRLFVDNYFGNATEAARKAGYSHPKQQGSRLLSNVDVQAAIKEQENGRFGDHILDRQGRRELLTRFVLGLEFESIVVKGLLKRVVPSLSIRLKALELLGKIDGDFSKKVEVEMSLQQELDSLSQEEIKERIRRLEQDGVLDLFREND